MGKEKSQKQPTFTLENRLKKLEMEIYFSRNSENETFYKRECQAPNFAASYKLCGFPPLRCM